MTIDPIWRNRLFAVGASAIAVWLSFEIAAGQLLWPTVITGMLLLLFLSRYQPLPLRALLLTAVTAGYVIGNRGFAQLSLSPNLPFLPAEGVLLVAGSLLLVQCAWSRELPFRRDALNLALLAWIACGTLRVGFDVSRYGVVALRDFALVYYAAFFFLGQDLARDPRAKRVFLAVLLAASTLLVLIFPLYERFPNFFFSTLVLRGTPLIFYKGDLVVTFIAVGAVLFFLRFESNGKWWNALASLALVAVVLASNNRAAMLALFAATAWLAFGGRWHFAAAQAVVGVMGVALILAVAGAARTPWQKTPLFGIYERIVSIADPTGLRSYQGAETFSKGDNNLYRAVWWRAVFDETVEENPYLGLGFGRDLAARFVRIYYPESEEFNVRSPHNVLLTVFARMGALGLAIFLTILAIIAVRTRRAIHAGAAEAGSWCAVWIILTSACLGVVLEGPMGAVVFWTVLGVANAPTPDTDPAPAITEPAGAEQTLPLGAPAHEGLVLR
jgi:O-antigen ligase